MGEKDKDSEPVKEDKVEEEESKVEEEKKLEEEVKEEKEEKPKKKDKKTSTIKKNYLIAAGILIICMFAHSQQPQFSIQTLFGPTGYVWNNNSSADLNADFNYSAGVYIQANIPVQESRIFIRSGYFVDTKHYSLNLSNSSPYWYRKL